MQEKTSGIVLHSIKHNDSSTIVYIYTRHFGRVSYSIYGMGKKNSRCRPAFLQPFSLVEMDVSHLPSKELQRIKDIRPSKQLINILCDPIKSALALFLSEVLFRTLTQTDADEELYKFIESAVIYLNDSQSSNANFHLVFLLKLTRYMGFEPNRDSPYTAYFDLQEGSFSLNRPTHGNYLDTEYALLLQEFLATDFQDMDRISLTREKRRRLLNAIIEFYKLHIPEFRGLRSLDVLHNLFD